MISVHYALKKKNLLRLYCKLYLKICKDIEYG